jgi:hypothetical protein
MRRIQGEGWEEKEEGEGMTQGDMEVGVDKGDVEVTGISKAKNKDVMEGREKETGLRRGGQLEEEGEVTEEERRSSPKPQKN